MVHREDIQVYKHVLTVDDYGTTTEALVLQTTAPTVGTVKPLESREADIALRMAPELLVEVLVNWRDDFVWDNTMRIKCSRYDLLEVVSAKEKTRRRLLSLTCKVITTTWQAR